MKKRLRKKLHYAEFTEYGFRVTFKFVFRDDDERNAILDEQLDFIEARHLEEGGGGSEDEWDVFIAGWKRSATEEDREAVKQWCVNHPKVTAYSIGPLVDAWHGSMKDMDAKLEYVTKTIQVGDK